MRDLEADFEAVDSGVRQFKPRLAERLDALLGEGASDASLLLLDRTGTLARSKLDRLVAVSDGNASESADLGEPRQRRDALAVASYGNLKLIRRLLEATNGKRAGAPFGLTGRLPRSALGVHQLGRHFLKAFAERGLPESPHAVIDIQNTVRALQADIASLGRTLEHVTVEYREAEGFKIASDKAREDLKRALSRYAALATALLTLAGLDEEARRLRRKRPRLDDSAAPDALSTGT